jgi:hypothetical protein
MSRWFRTIVVVDFEYEIDEGDCHVLCMVAYVLDENQLVTIIRRW